MRDRMIGQQEELRLDRVRREMRDPDPAVWQAACRDLALLALEYYGAHEEIRRVVTCPYGEMRLRGVHALSCLAPERPQEARQFFLECLAESDVATDPVLADALFSLVAQFPPDMASHLVDDASDDPRETVRAAAASSLSLFRGWRGGLLLDFASDPSPQVRCSVAMALASLRDVREAGEALERLAASPEPYVRAYLAEIVDGPGTRAEQPRGPRPPVPDPDDLGVVRGRLHPRAVTARLATLLEEPDCRVRLVVKVEELFSAHPQYVAEILYPLLDRAGVPSLLDQLVWLVRDSSVADLCRTLLGTVRPGLERRDLHLRALLDALDGQLGPHAATLRGWVDACARGAAADGIDAIVAWAHTVDHGRFSPLIDFVAALQSCEDMAGLHQLLGQMDEIYRAIDEAYVMPEQALVRMVAECWIDVLDQELQDQVSGVNS